MKKIKEEIKVSEGLKTGDHIPISSSNGVLGSPSVDTNILKDVSHIPVSETPPSDNIIKIGESPEEKIRRVAMEIQLILKKEDLQMMPIIQIGPANQ